MMDLRAADRMPPLCEVHSLRGQQICQHLPSHTINDPHALDLMLTMGKVRSLGGQEICQQLRRSGEHAAQHLPLLFPTHGQVPFQGSRSPPVQQSRGLALIATVQVASGCLRGARWRPLWGVRSCCSKEKEAVKEDHLCECMQHCSTPSGF